MPHAVGCDHNVNVRLENIDLFAANCFGFIETDCDGSTYYRCRIDRRSPADDPVKRADPRLRSLDADAYHSTFAGTGPAYLECVARFMGDDCVNICGDYHMIAGSSGQELRVLAKGAMNIQPGDPVELAGFYYESGADELVFLTNVPGTPPTNTYIDTSMTLPSRFYRVTVTN